MANNVSYICMYIQHSYDIIVLVFANKEHLQNNKLDGFTSNQENIWVRQQEQKKEREKKKTLFYWWTDLLK